MMWSEKLAGSRAPIEKRKNLEEEWELYMTTPILAANAGQIDDIISDEQLRAKDCFRYGNAFHEVGICKALMLSNIVKRW